MKGQYVLPPPTNKNVNDLYIKFGHSSKTITQATTKALGIQITILSNHEDCDVGKAKQQKISILFFWDRLLVISGTNY